MNPAYKSKYGWNSFLWHVGSQWVGLVRVTSRWRLAGLRWERQTVCSGSLGGGIGSAVGVGSRERVRRDSPSPAHPRSAWGAGRVGRSLVAMASLTFRSWQQFWGVQVQFPLNHEVFLLCDLYQRCPVTLGQCHPLWRDKGAWTGRKLPKNSSALSCHCHHPLRLELSLVSGSVTTPLQVAECPSHARLSCQERRHVIWWEKHWVCRPTFLTWILALSLTGWMDHKHFYKCKLGLIVFFLTYFARLFGRLTGITYMKGLFV